MMAIDKKGIVKLIKLFNQRYDKHVHIINTTQYIYFIVILITLYSTLNVGDKIN